MEEWSWVLIAILTLIIIGLIVKLWLLRKATDEIRLAFAERLATDTNTLIDTSSRDRHILLLADAINMELRQLRTERRRFVQGDVELKEAVTNIAHDLRTPITAISGYLQLLEREERDETVNRYLDMIRNRTEALKSLTEELFRYSVLTSQTELITEPVEINAILEESLITAYGALTQKGIVPEIIMPEKKVERKLDRSALFRIFENIISNAVKYSAGDLKVILFEDGVIEFSNTAPDLDSVTAGRLFDRFYTVETVRNSTGLGLSIAKLLTERMGGDISAEYRQNKLYILIRFE